VKLPAELGPGGLAVHLDHHVVRPGVACREHSGHDLLKYIPPNGVEAVLFAQGINEGDVGRMRPDLRQQLEVNCIDRLGYFSKRW
jgi:hypothetical protein